jgi:deferrochelatase/peroxidase EfeB
VASETRPASGVSRRGLLGVSAGAAAAGVAVGFGSGYATRAAAEPAPEATPATAPASLDAPIPFRGPHQAGIVTPAQDRMHFVALDVVTRDRAQLVDLLKKWTRAAERMTAGA